jgi:NAD(P)-dependent dehydrogenase (short-subunit alcohol dehydrogenase family)
MTDRVAGLTDRFAGRVAVVTGGAGGMGLATVERFLAEGARVVVGDLNTDRGDALLAAAEADGVADRVRFSLTDVSIEPDVEALVAVAVGSFGRLDVMFNNAGIGGAFGPVTELEVDDWDATFAVNTRSVFLGIKHAARVMIAQGDGGSIINTASVAGLSGGGGPQAYSAAKAAVINLTQATAVELAEHRIRVNAICPGAIYTDLLHRGDPAAADEWRQRLQPWPDRGEGSDIAGVATWLASDDSRFVSGTHIVADGALTAAGPRLTQHGNTLNYLNQLVGFAWGTTGKAARYRRLTG